MPRYERSETGWPNWSVSVKSGAGRESAVPGSRYGLLASALADDEEVSETVAITTATPATTARNAAPDASAIRRPGRASFAGSSSRRRRSSARRPK